MSSTTNTNTYATSSSVINMVEKQEKKNVEIDEELFIQLLHGNSSSSEDKAIADLGLWKVWAYHCIRCKYVWFPRYAEFQHVTNEAIMFNLEPPKSCARCKSKYWNQIPRREIKKK